MENDHVSPDAKAGRAGASMGSRIAAWLLCLAGVLLVLLSNPLGVLMVQQRVDANTVWMQPEDARHAAEAIRWVGGMVFAAGLVERIVGVIAKNRSV